MADLLAGWLVIVSWLLAGWLAAWLAAMAFVGGLGLLVGSLKGLR